MKEDEQIIADFRKYELNDEEIKKMLDLNDNRSVSNELLNAFYDINGEFYEFKKHVDKNDKKFAVCFRGNGEPEAITIYHNNHMVWELSYYPESNEYEVKINFNHARYDKNWKSKLNTIKDLFEIEKELKPCEKKRKKESSVSIEHITCKKKKGENYYTIDFVEETSRIILECMDSYFDPFERKDYFREEVLKQEYFNEKKNACVEKQWQQELFYYFKNTDNGIYVYDLEFSQKFPSAPDPANERKNIIKEKLQSIINEPDMLGIRFENSKPKNLVLIEVKSTYTGCRSKKSGITQHLTKMKKYSNSRFFVNNRIDEAKKIFDQLKTLGYVDKGINKEDVKKLKNSKVEKILILTTDVVQVEKKDDEGKIVKRMFETKKGSAIKYYEDREKSKKKGVIKVTKQCMDNECSLWIVRERMDEDYKVEHILDK